jgi:hypothetical protein
MISHQLRLRVPGPALQWSANQALRLALSKFDAVWAPDVADAAPPSPVNSPTGRPYTRPHATPACSPVCAPTNANTNTTWP